MREWRIEMRREMEHLQQVIDGLGEAIGSRLTALQADMAREFDEQKRLSQEQIDFNQEQIRFNKEQARFNQEQERRHQEQERRYREQERRYQEQDGRYQEHHRSVSRMSVSFDQSLTEMHTEVTRRIRTGSVLWSTLTERTAEMQLDIERLENDTENLRRRVESETESLRHRVDAIEKRLAG